MGQQFKNGLSSWFCLKVAHEIAVKMLAGLLLSESLFEDHFQVGSLTQLLASLNRSASNENCYALVICHEGLSID